MSLSTDWMQRQEWAIIAISRQREYLSLSESMDENKQFCLAAFYDSC